MPPSKKSKLRKPRKHKVNAFDDRLRYAIPEAAGLLRISRAKLYINIAAGLIFTIKDGKRNFIPGSEIARLSMLPSQAAKS